ncbi:MAG: CBS domain-containing protein [Porphyromonadaceae bacterium]|nr:MAG: CBS domain-containing protein [Porphyromonadaceae bacterium]
MLAQDLVSNLISAVTGSDTASQVLDRMVKFRVSHLPVIDQTEYLGLISEKDIREFTDPGQLIGTQVINLLAVSVIENQHVYEVIDLVSRYELTLLPVLTPAKEYAGSITLPSLVRNFSMLTAAGQPGAILVLSLALQDYSPTMLSRIIEDNNAKMISLYVIPDPNGRELTVTIKVNTQETSSLMRSFDRYGYTVKSYFLANSQLDDFYRSRYEEFMKYMNI